MTYWCNVCGRHAEAITTVGVIDGRIDKVERCPGCNAVVYRGKEFPTIETFAFLLGALATMIGISLRRGDFVARGANLMGMPDPRAITPVGHPAPILTWIAEECLQRAESIKGVVV